MRTRISIAFVSLYAMVFAAVAGGMQVPVTRTGFFCDEPEQIAHVIGSIGKSMGSNDAVLSRVNAMYDNKKVCGHMQAEYFMLRRIGSIETARGRYTIAQVVVVGWWLGGRQIDRDSAYQQYAAFLEDGEV